jgi:hypothetical protein
MFPTRLHGDMVRPSSGILLYSYSWNVLDCSSRGLAYLLLELLEAGSMPSSAFAQILTIPLQNNTIVGHTMIKIISKHLGRGEYRQGVIRKTINTVTEKNKKKSTKYLSGRS